MRIRGSATSSVSPSTAPSPSSCSSSSSCFSSHSSISSHSLASSSSSSSTTPTTPHRCHGLDLLVKAVYYVAGSVIGVPYIQRRVIRRRKPALRFTNLVVHDRDKLLLDCNGKDEVLDYNSDLLETPNLIIKKNKQRRRSKAVPLKSKQPRRRRRSSFKG